MSSGNIASVLEGWFNAMLEWRTWLDVQLMVSWMSRRAIGSRSWPWWIDISQPARPQVRCPLKLCDTIVAGCRVQSRAIAVEKKERIRVWRNNCPGHIKLGQLQVPPYRATILLLFCHVCVWEMLFSSTNEIYNVVVDDSGDGWWL